MATFNFATETSRITSRPAVAIRVANAVSNVYRAWKNRRAFYRLGEMSDAELADIGLTRADRFGVDTETGLQLVERSRRYRRAHGAAGPPGRRPSRRPGGGADRGVRHKCPATTL